jgi:hypothetical protein
MEYFLSPVRPRGLAHAFRVGLCLLLTAGSVPWQSWAQGPGAPEGARKVRLEVLYSSSLFRTINRNDALAAMRVWISAIGRSRGLDMESNVSIVDDLNAMRKLVREGPPGLVLLDVEEYFELSGLGVLEPVFFGSADATLLVANPDFGVTGISDLRGKAVTIFTASRADLGRKWMQVLLHEGGYGVADQYLRSMTSVPSPSAAVLPVFFGKSGAAVVSQFGLDVLKEMNPQVGAKLRVLASTKPMAEGVLCFHRRFTESRQLIWEALRDLHRDPAGKQILLLFKSGGLVPVHPQILEEARALELRYKRMAERQAPRKLPASAGLAVGAAGQAPGASQ